MRSHSQSKHGSEVINVLLRSSRPVDSRVVLGTGLLSRLPDFFVQAAFGERALIVCSSSVRSHWVEIARRSLADAGLDITVLEVPDGEEAKDYSWLLKAWNILQEKSFTRQDTVLSVGGGAVSDLAGFVAATYLRGIKLALVPTTLLAQVDAAIGGKTGINLPAGKNLAGTFYFPELVLVDPQVLSTLPKEQVSSGLAEIIKYGLLETTIAEHTEYQAGPRLLFDLLESELSRQPFSAKHPAAANIILACIKMKLAVVGKDPLEGKLRRCLNLGHTLGHAIEKVSGYSVSHGQAVAIGTVFACRLSHSMQRLEALDLERVTAVFQSAQLPTALDDSLDRASLLTAMKFDKKRAGDAINYVLPISPLGAVDLDTSIDVEQLSAVL